MLRTRIITALVLVGLLVGAALWSRLALTVLCAACLGMTLFEWLRLSGVPQRWAALGAAAAAAAAVALEIVALRPGAGLLAVLCLLACLAWAAIGL
jgi:CDP-diglyceride synthetase